MARPIQLFDTRRRAVLPLEPLQPEQVSIYTCGPTVYFDPHIGNYRTYIFQDVLVKTLRHFGYDVQRVMNVTDVGHLVTDSDEGEDKLEVGARREGLTAWEVARKYQARFIADLQRFDLDVPARLIRATDTIAAQIALIQTLEAKGMTYPTPDGIYFDASTFPTYADFAQLDLAGQQAGARVEVVEGKRHPYDFALWKFSPTDHQRDMEWESPWGVGFPGWHIECSAIALQQLGPELDIHCGGVDHIPVHHSNEIAQSESATGKLLARHWCHTEFLQVDGGKMGKSLGNSYTLSDLETAGIDPLAFKLFTYSAHYRSKLNFTWDGVKAAQKNLQRLRHLLQQDGQGSERGTYLERFETSLANDVNLPEALAVLWELAHADLQRSVRQPIVGKMDQMLGLHLLEVTEVKVPEAVLILVEAREQARLAKDFASADSLRQQIEIAGFQVLDTADGPQLQTGA